MILAVAVDILKFVGSHQLFSCLLVLTYMTNKVCMYVCMYVCTPCFEKAQSLI